MSENSKQLPFKSLPYNGQELYEIYIEAWYTQFFDYYPLTTPPPSWRDLALVQKRVWENFSVMIYDKKPKPFKSHSLERIDA